MLKTIKKQKTENDDGFYYLSYYILFNKIFRNFKLTSLKSGLQKTFKWYKENEKKR